jgi:hypothetical protein
MLLLLLLLATPGGKHKLRGWYCGPGDRGPGTIDE